VCQVLIEEDSSNQAGGGGKLAVSLPGHGGSSVIGWVYEQQTSPPHGEESGGLACDEPDHGQANPDYKKLRSHDVEGVLQYGNNGYCLLSARQAGLSPDKIGHAIPA